MAAKTRPTSCCEAAFAKARKVMPHGVASPGRSFARVGAAGGPPVVVKEAKGCVVTDVDGNRYIDYVAAHGSLIAGHANEQVVAALSKAIGRGTTFGLPTESETQLATLILAARGFGPPTEATDPTAAAPVTSVVTSAVAHGGEGSSSRDDAGRGGEPGEGDGHGLPSGPSPDPSPEPSPDVRGDGPVGESVESVESGGVPEPADAPGESGPSGPAGEDRPMRVQFINGMFEALWEAADLARAHTGRPLVASVTAYEDPGPAGVPGPTVPFNDAPAVAALLDAHAGRIAGLIVPPVSLHGGLVPPADGYLRDVRAVCDAHGVLLIFDETITGLRLAVGGAASLYGVRPDLSCLGSTVGGGLPLSCVVGPRDVLERDLPEGLTDPLGGIPLAAAAGVATLDVLREPDTYEQLDRAGDTLARGLLERADAHGVPLTVHRVGSMVGLFFADGGEGGVGEGGVGGTLDAVADSPSVDGVPPPVRTDGARYAAFHAAMLDGGVLLPPHPLSPLFVGLSHDDDAIAATLAAADDAFAAVAAMGEAEAADATAGMAE